ncbi:adenylate cyclase [Bacillus sp. DTU_2020_1000418_1_SI_GHA_SEK_038]|uniref:F390 synthetase-related protein n=1 Tax=Bacillus sp. DTU_2020_1000418_1_SI_GHA_SEK_038 TaxID=3077585 RepID=UPI0028E35F4A|nr:F390 synthetase-related protein [Bacillus sp. DTU_2020_1000418_1_SI_GHA_SEK_038]WNS75029.1 adenylate cyclase [Bacillus sp. DTU_2020_1000418_1_SI_GHA_SEK_038]
MNKMSILKQYIVTKFGRKFASRQELEAYQKKKIKKHLEFVLASSPFYRQFYKGYEEKITHNRWDQLPMIDKSVMMENFDSLNTVGIKKEEALQVAFEAENSRDFSPKIGDISVGLSSGTSGNRGIFLISDQESALWAGTILAKVLPGSILGKHQIAFFLRANNNLYTSTENGRIAFHFFDLLDDFAEHIRKLKAVQPTIVIGPPSILRKVADWQANGDIGIHPRKIVSVAEVLEDIDKTYIEGVFQQTLHQVYQCTEGFLAATCSHGTLHMNEDLVVIEKEYLDDGVFVPIITDFSRTTQPIIRYRLNDILVERVSPCPCGSHYLALERIDGRCDDIFYGKQADSGELSPLFPDFIRRAIMFSSEDILEYKVIQKNWEELEVKVKFRGNEKRVQEKIERELTKLWAGKGLLIPIVHFTPYDILPSEKKLKRIESQMKGSIPT